MKITVLLAFAMLFGFACASRQDGNIEKEIETENSALLFNEVMWKTKDGVDYPYRDRMLNDVLYNDTIRALKREEILNLLGEADRENEGHLYYQVNQRRIGSWPLHTKSMVIKFSEADSIEWIKVHK